MPYGYNGDMSHITPVEVRRIAALAYIEISDDQVDHFAAELEQIMEYVRRLQAVDVHGVAPTSQISGLSNVMRADEVQPGLTYEQIQQNAPDWLDGHFKVKRVLRND